MPRLVRFVLLAIGARSLMRMFRGSPYFGGSRGRYGSWRNGRYRSSSPRHGPTIL